MVTLPIGNLVSGLLKENTCSSLPQDAASPGGHTKRIRMTKIDVIWGRSLNPSQNKFNKNARRKKPQRKANKKASPSSIPCLPHIDVCLLHNKNYKIKKREH